MRFSSDVLPRQPLTCAQPGDARLHLVPEHVLRNPVLELLDEEGPLRARADDGHVALEHVPELRQLVDVVLAQPAADAAWRAGRCRGAQIGPGHVLGVDRHRPELVDGERPCRRGPSAPACRTPGRASRA